MIREKRSAPSSTEGPLQEGQSPASSSPLPTASPPLRFLIVTAIAVFVSEALIMVVLPLFPSLSMWETALVDATLILICSIPALYFWLYRPLVRSLTERLEAKAVLRDSEEKFRVLVESINAIPWRFDLKGNQFTYIGHQVERILGFPVDSWTDIDSWANRIHAADRQAAVDYCMCSTGKGEDHDFEYRCIKPNGEIVWLRDIVTVRKDKEGKPFELVGYMVDITERKRAEEALRQSEGKLSSVISSSPDAITVADLKGVIVSCNQQTAEIHGYFREDDLIGLNLWSLVHPDYSSTTEDNLKLVFAKGAVRNIELVLLREDGSSFPAEMSISIARNERGEPESLIAITKDITKRKRAEEALRESEEKYRSVIEGTDDLVTRVDADGVFTYVNHVSKRVLGVDQAQCRGLSSFDFVHPNDQEKTKAWFKECIAGQVRRAAIENRQVNRETGTVAILLWTCRFLYSADGQLEGVNSIARDISERKQAEEALRESENKLLYAQKIARLGYYVLDIRTGIWTNSAELDDIFGLDEEYHKDVGSWLSIVHSDFRDSVLHHFQDHVLSQHREFDKEYKIVDVTTGQEKWVHGLGSLRFDKDSEPVEMFGTIQDITERKRAEAAVRESEEKFRTYVSSAPDAIFIADAEGRYVEVNVAACKITGYSESELLNMSIFELLAPDARSEGVESFKLLKKTGSSRVNLKQKRKDNSIIWMSIDAVALSDDRFMAFCSDITETRRLQELESRAQRLETAGTIAGQVAHDFNNLLAPLIAYPDFIREDLPGNHPALAYLDDIESSAKKIADINQQLLTLGRRGHYNQETLNLNAIVHHAVKEMESLPATVSCETDLAEDLMNITGGSAQIHRVISNLLHNAKDAIQEVGQITVKTENLYVDDVSVAYGRVARGEYVRLTVSDTGCGIPDNIVQKIFDPFFTSKTTDKKRGSGLGLSVVDSVVRDHEGFLDLETKLGEGSSFFIYFPPTRDELEGQSVNISTGGNETVLIVDDDEIQRQVSTKLLERSGYKVSAVESGEKAIDLLRETSFDLLILDMIMPPGIDGAETFRRVLEISPTQKAIIVSGFSESEQVMEVQKLGAGAFVRKPLTHKSISIAVREELDRVREPLRTPS